MSAAVETAPETALVIPALVQEMQPRGESLHSRNNESGRLGNKASLPPTQPISSYHLLIWFWTSIVGLLRALPPTIQGVCDSLDSIIAGLCSFFHLLLRRQHRSMLLSPTKHYFLEFGAVLADKMGFWPLPIDWSGAKQYLIPPSIRTNEPRVTGLLPHANQHSTTSLHSGTCFLASLSFPVFLWGWWKCCDWNLVVLELQVQSSVHLLFSFTSALATIIETDSKLSCSRHPTPLLALFSLSSPSCQICCFRSADSHLQ